MTWFRMQGNRSYIVTRFVGIDVRDSEQRDVLRTAHRLDFGPNSFSRTDKARSIGADNIIYTHYI